MQEGRQCSCRNMHQTPPCSYFPPRCGCWAAKKLTAGPSDHWCPSSPWHWDQDSGTQCCSRCHGAGMHAGLAHRASLGNKTTTAVIVTYCESLRQTDGNLLILNIYLCMLLTSAYPQAWIHKTVELNNETDRNCCKTCMGQCSKIKWPWSLQIQNI